MRNLLLALALALTACTAPKPVPDPVTPPDPPEPAEDAGLRPYPETPCGRACAALDGMGCPGAGPRCVEACERYEDLAVEAPALGWNPSCIASAPDCKAMEACRGR